MKRLGFSGRIAKRYLLSGRSEAAISVITVIAFIGVAIGVVTLNVVMAVMTGFQVTLREKILGADAHITVRAIGGKVERWEPYKAKIAAIPEVRSVSAFTTHQVLLKAQSHSTGLLIRGVEEGSEAAQQLLQYLKDSPDPQATLSTLFAPQPLPTLSVSEDGEEEEVTLPSILIGRSLAQNAGLFPGSTISLLSSQVSSSPFGLMPKFRRFVVVGSYKSGLTEYENGLAYIALGEAQKFFRLGNAVQGFEVRVNNLDRSKEITRKILDTLGGGFIAEDWSETNQAFFEAMALEKRVYFLVLLLIVVMASFSIVSSLVMLVIEKRRDIAILRTLGARSRDIGNIFRLQGAVIGGLGVSIGLILSYGVCKGLQTYGFPIDERIFQMSTLPVYIDPLNFTFVGLAAFAICCIATLYPAWRATRLDPNELLRNDG